MNDGLGDKKSGVKSLDGKFKLHRKNVMLDDDSIQILEKVGSGNLSLGTREAARRLKESLDMAPFNMERHENRMFEQK